MPTRPARSLERPYLPILYVRGYAGSDATGLRGVVGGARGTTMALLLTACVTGCVGEGPPLPSLTWVSTVDTTASGVLVVRNTPPSIGITPRWILDPELRLGSPLRTEPDSLGVIRQPDAFELIKGMAPLPGGGFAVLEARAQEIRLFDDRGTHLSTLGGRGEAPGQLNDANGLLVGPDGRILVHDPRNARLSLFDPVSGLVVTRPVEVRTFDYVWQAAIDGEGRVFDPTLAVRSGEVWDAVAVLGPDGLPSDTVLHGVAALRSELDSEGLFEGAEVRGPTRIEIPFRPPGLRVIDPRGFLWAQPPGSNDYRIVKTTLSGDTVLVSETGRERTPVSPAARDSAILELRLRSGGQELDWSRLPTERPLVEGGFLDDQGHLWIRTGAEADGTWYDVVDSGGQHMGTVRAPFRVPPHLHPVVRGNAFYAVELGDDGVTRIVLGRLREHPPGGGLP